MATLPTERRRETELPARMTQSPSIRMQDALWCHGARDRPGDSRGEGRPGRSLGSTQTMNLLPRVSEDVEDEVRALVEFLFVPVVPAVRMAEKTEDAVSAVVVPIIRALNLRNDSLFAGVAIPPVVEPVVLEPVARNLRGHVRPVQVIRPVLRLC